LPSTMTMSSDSASTTPFRSARFFMGEILV